MTEAKRKPAFRLDDPDRYVLGTPHCELGRLRREAPFEWNEHSGLPCNGYWLATKYRDVASISKNPSLFATSAPLLQAPLPREAWSDFPAGAMIANNLLTFDHRKHPAARSLIATLLNRATILSLEPSIRSLCEEFLQRIAPLQRFDFAQQVALPLPISVVLGLVLGIPAVDHDMLSRDVLAINAMEDPRFCRPAGGMISAAEELYHYGMRHLGRLAHSSGRGVLAELLGAKQDAVSNEELFFTYWFPLMAGAFDTTAAIIAGSMHALLEHSEQARHLRESPGLIPLAAEEIIRWICPVIYFRRTATADTEFAEKRIHKGDAVILCYASANRDEDVFGDPDAFDVSREPNPHLSFGYGPHYCVGASLARTTVQIFLEQFLPHLQDFVLDGEVIRTRSAWMNRIWSMPLRRRH